MKQKLLSLIIFVFITGCASRKEIVQFKRDTFYLRQQVEALRLENKEIRKMMLDINKSIVSLQDETRKSRADLFAEIENIKTQSQVIDSKLEDATYRMSNIMPVAKDKNHQQAITDSTAVSSTVQMSEQPFE